MKRILGYGAAVVALVCIGACAPATKAGEAAHRHHDHDREVTATARPAPAAVVTIDQVKQRLETNLPTVFIDTRNELVWQASDTLIPGAIRISNNAQLAAMVKELPKESFIVPYCT